MDDVAPHCVAVTTRSKSAQYSSPYSHRTSEWRGMSAVATTMMCGRPQCHTPTKDALARVAASGGLYGAGLSAVTTAAAAVVAAAVTAAEAVAAVTVSASAAKAAANASSAASAAGSSSEAGVVPLLLPAAGVVPRLVLALRRLAPGVVLRRPAVEGVMLRRPPLGVMLRRPAAALSSPAHATMTLAGALMKAISLRHRPALGSAE